MTLVHADPDEAGTEQDALIGTLRRIFRRRTGHEVAELLDPATGFDLRYPGAFGVGLALPPPEADTAPFDAEVRRLAAPAAAHAERAAAFPCPGWSVDLAPPEEHLARSVARAIAQAPERPDRGRPDGRVVNWTPAERATAAVAAELIATACPVTFAELSLVVRQVALVAGRGVNGFTDFGVMGAIMINRRRLAASAEGLPGPVRFAEALVHEGAHVRCNASGAIRPYLADPADRSVTVRTPLRRDARPLNGLFQQLVVLVRCAELYDRLLALPDRPGPELGEAELAAVRARRDTLHAQAEQAAATLDEHRDGLSERGRAELDLALDRLMPSGRR